MLVLARKNGERVVIGRDIEVTVLKVRGNSVKLGITGPIEIPIQRGELQRKSTEWPTAGVQKEENQ